MKNSPPPASLPSDTDSVSRWFRPAARELRILARYYELLAAILEPEKPRPPTRFLSSVSARLNILALFASLTIAATGCTVLTYKSPTGEHFTRSSLGSKTSIAHLTFEANTNGVRKLQLKGYDNDSSQSLGVVTDAAVRAALSAAKP